MKLLQIDNSALRGLESRRFLIVESQEYGQPTDFLFHVVVNNKNAKELLKLNGVREIKDTGRTVGFWQRLGGKGVYHPELVTVNGFRDGLCKVLGKCKEAKIGFEGKTWKAIIKSMPFMPEALEAIGIDERKSVDKKSTK